MRFKYIFVVLVYKNTDVLHDFYKSLRSLDDYKVILVNSFYDDESLEKCNIIAKKYNSDFVRTENKGYGHGNNVGIEYAIKNYDFDFLIVSNSDIIINDLNKINTFIMKDCIIAPETKMLTGKKQNPNIPFFSSAFLQMIKYAYDNDSRLCLKIAHAYGRLCRYAFFLYSFFIKKPYYQIFSCHGSFFAITYPAIKKMHPLFSEEMFLYNEELYLAFHAKDIRIPIYYCPLIKVKHLEGASSNEISSKGFELNKQSFKIVQKKYINEYIE